MKRNVIIFLSIFIITTISSISCSKFLEKNPLDAASSETFWTTEKDLDMALTGCYRRLRDEVYFGWKRVDLDCLTDNAQQRHNHGSVTDISRGIIEPNTGGIISSIWSSAYRGIATCNTFLENVDRVQGVPEARKNQYIAEVRFLRAFFYFDLVHFFGDVPLYKTVPTIESAKISQSPKEEVLAFIHEDLDFAIENLPNQQYTDGHAVRGSAQGYKARVLLYEDKFQQAAELCKTIIDDGQFSLSPSYSNIFITKGQADNPEIMFSTRYLAPDDYTWMDIEVSWWGSNNPRQELVDAYPMANGKFITDPTSGFDPVHPYQNRDPRLRMTVMVDGEVWKNPDGTNYTPEVSGTGHRQKKYIDSTLVPIDYATRSDQDFVHLRYADVLLMYAEAMNEFIGPDPSVYQALNQIRSRPDVSLPNITGPHSQEELRDIIRRERRLELALEGHRYYDLKRWNLAHIIMPTVQDAAGVQIRFDNPKHYLWPYQQSELDINPALSPNPNY